MWQPATSKQSQASKQSGAFYFSRDGSGWRGVFHEAQGAGGRGRSQRRGGARRRRGGVQRKGAARGGGGWARVWLLLKWRVWRRRGRQKRARGQGRAAVGCWGAGGGVFVQRGSSRLEGSSVKKCALGVGQRGREQGSNNAGANRLLTSEQSGVQVVCVLLIGEVRRLLSWPPRPAAGRVVWEQKAGGGFQDKSRVIFLCVFCSGRRERDSESSFTRRAAGYLSGVLWFC